MIRKATRADYPRISEIRLSVRENRLSKSKYDLVERVANWLLDNSAFWVWEEDGVVQGFSAADTRDGMIFALFVHPSHEGRGIGRALLPGLPNSSRQRPCRCHANDRCWYPRRTVLSSGRLVRSCTTRRRPDCLSEGALNCATPHRLPHFRFRYHVGLYRPRAHHAHGPVAR